MDDSSTNSSPDGPATNKLVGAILDGRYLIEKELGHGGVGAVYLARDHKLHDKPVVVKILLEKSLRDAWFMQKFQQEKEALARVDHPGVVGILDMGELPDGKPYIVMQYVEGMALRDAIKAKPEGMDLERVASMIKQIGAALSAVHEKKIYHRDLKPENIMLQALGRGDEQVKIVDFGIAKIKESVIAPSTITGTATAGTIVYMSPEQLRGAKVSAAGDIYSLGVIAYEMVTGRRPFNPDTTAHLSDMQREGVRAKPSDLRPRLPDEAERIMLKALAFEPTARYQNAGEFGDALALALMNENETLKLHRKDQVLIPPTQPAVQPAFPDPHPGGLPPAKTMVRLFEPARVYPHEQPIPSPVQPKIQKRRWPKLAVGLVLALALGGGGYLLITKRQSLFGSGATSNPISPEANKSQPVDSQPTNTQPSNSGGNKASEPSGAAKTSASQPESQQGIEFVLIPAGVFMMGSTYGMSNETPVHRVAIGQPFYMGKYEVTQGQWQAGMGHNPSFKKCDTCPVNQVSWDDAQLFLAQLNERNDGFYYRLPSEAEWEYACRAKTIGDYAGDLDSIAWYYKNSGSGYNAHPVGTKQANGWGLYDMHGNVMEWCQDLFHGNYNGAPVDGSTWEAGADKGYRVLRVLRGGSSNVDASELRSASRRYDVPSARGGPYGLRVVRIVRTQ